MSKLHDMYVNAWVGIRYEIENTDYCKAIREDNIVPAFQSTLCEKCIKKKCKFLNICIELHEINVKDKKEGERCESRKSNKAPTARYT